MIKLTLLVSLAFLALTLSATIPIPQEDIFPHTQTRDKLSSPFLNPNPNPIAFTTLGKTAVTQGNAHVVATIPVVDIGHVVHSVLILITRLSHDYGQKYTPLLHSLRAAEVEMLANLNALGLFDVYSRTLTNNRHFLDTQKSLFSNHPGLSPPEIRNSTSLAHSRQERFVTALLAALGVGFVANAALSAYSASQMTSIHQAAADTARQTDILAQAIAEANTNIGRLRNAIVLQREQLVSKIARQDVYDNAAELVHRCQHVIGTVTNSVTAALAGNVDPTIFDPTHLGAALSNITHRAHLLNLSPVVTEPRDIATLPTSTALSKSGSLILFVHVPLTNKKYDMTLYELHLLPIHTPAGYLDLDISTPFLAVADQPSTMFYALSAFEFEKCIKASTVFVCPNRNYILNTNSKDTGYDEQRCVHALHRADDTGVANHCRARPVQPKQYVARTGASSFNLYAKEPHRITITCNGKVEDRATVSGFVGLHLPTGCVADTDSGFIWPTLTVEDATTSYTAYSLPESLEKFANMTSAIIKAAVEEQRNIRDSIQLQHEASRRLPLVEKINEAFRNGHPLAYTSTTAVLVIGIGIFAVAALFRKRQLQHRAELAAAKAPRFNAVQSPDASQVCAGSHTANASVLIPFHNPVYPTAANHGFPVTSTQDLSAPNSSSNTTPANASQPITAVRYNAAQEQVEIAQHPPPAVSSQTQYLTPRNP